MSKDIYNEILDLERSLLSREVRSNSEMLEKLIHLDFMEIGTTGNIYDYQRVVAELPLQEFETLDISEEEGRFLSSDLYILNFTIKRSKTITRRTSIWKNEESDWKLIFHQSTPILGKPLEN